MEKKTAAQVQATEALAALLASDEVKALHAKLAAAQKACDADGASWDTREGHRVESAAGHLMLALEAAGYQF